MTWRSWSCARMSIASSRRYKACSSPRRRPLERSFSRSMGGVSLTTDPGAGMIVTRYPSVRWSGSPDSGATHGASDILSFVRASDDLVLDGFAAERARASLPFHRARALRAGLLPPAPRASSHRPRPERHAALREASPTPRAHAAVDSEHPFEQFGLGNLLGLHADLRGTLRIGRRVRGPTAT